MGAEFLWARVPACELTEERKQTLNQAIDNLDPELLEYVQTEYEVTTEDLRKALEDYGDFSCSPREVDLINWKGLPCKYWLTGGMSGDEIPTDAMETMEVIRLFDPIYDKLEKWAKEDKQ